MDCTCNCFGMASAARVPVKRYNLLVPDVFPVVEPSFGKPLGITVERKIKKLAEYLDKNEHRAPKVSRRLQRRLYKELRSGGYGYVQLAVQTYAYLLQHSRPEKSNLLANELVVHTVVKRRRLLFGLAGSKQYIPFREPHLGSAVGLLLTHKSPLMRKLGVDLLVDFIKCQHTSDYVPQLEAFVPLLCENAKPRKTVAAVPLGGVGAASSGTTSPGTARSARSASAGSSWAAAEAVQAAAVGEVGEEWLALRAACLRALLEHLRFCARLSYVSYHLHTITFAVLECVDASGFGAPQGRYMSPRAALSGSGNDSGELAGLEGLRRLSISRAVGASPPDVAALLVFEELAHMTRDAAEGKKVLEFVMRFLDAQHRWLGSPVVETSIAVLQQACEQEHQRYLLFSTLLHHVAGAEQLAPAERAAVLALATAEGAQLEAGLAAPALLLALRELPAVIASSCSHSSGSGDGEDVPPMPPARAPATPPVALLRPRDAEQEQQGQLNGSSETGAAAMPAAARAEGSSAAPASQQVLELPRLPLPMRPRGGSAAATGGPAARAGAGAAPVNLQEQVLEAVAQLAHRVQDSSQLTEAVSSTVTKLRGAAPISTAALQCCVAAAQAVKDLAPKMAQPGSTARTFPSLLLQELAGIMVHWQPQQRLLAHALLLQLLPAAPDGLKEQQAAVLLSALWHEAPLPGNRPAAFVAMDRTLAALLGAAPAAALPQAVKMLASLQLEVLQAGQVPAGGQAATAAAATEAGGGNSSSSSRLAGLPAAQACALLCVCRSALHTLAVQLGQPALEALTAPGCESVLLRLAVGRGEGDGEGAADVEAGQQQQQQQQQQRFWQSPATLQDFSYEEQQHAAAFLASWRQASDAVEQQAALAGALAAVPLFKQQQPAGGASSTRFQPMPASALRPRLMMGGEGGSFANGSHASGESKRATRLRNVYKHIRQTSLLDGDRVTLATISQESAAEEGLPATVQLNGLPLPGVPAGGTSGGSGSGSGALATEPQSVDDVLAEVDAALQAAEAQMAQGRSPSAAGWHSPADRRPCLGHGGGSNSSMASGGPQVPAAAGSPTPRLAAAAAFS